MALLSLWVAHPTGAYISHFLRYHPWIGRSASSIEIFGDHFRPHSHYVFSSLKDEDLLEAKGIFAGILRVHQGKHGFKRVLNYLNAAIHQGFWDSRFIMFTVVLESLFSTGNQEISHKLAERIAFFMGDEHERRSIFDRVKAIYSVRSTLVHGGDPSRIRGKESTKVSGDLEGIVQACVKRILMSANYIALFSSKPEIRDDFFTELVFGQRITGEPPG